MGRRTLHLAASLALVFVPAVGASGQGGAQDEPGRADRPPGPIADAAVGPKASPAGTRSGKVVWIRREAYVMGTRLRIRVAADARSAAVDASEAALETAEGLDDLLSTWREDTELARVNRAPVGEPVALSASLGSLLTEAFRWRERTGGAFDPAAGALVDAWGLRGDGRRPAPGTLEEALGSSGPAAIRLSPDGRTLTRRSDDAWVDPGGFGKGAALRRAREVLLERGVERALLDFGGQLLVLGSGPEGPGGWTVSVAHPRDRDRTVATFRVSDASVATTGTSERFVQVEGDTVGHVLDPRTGRPVPAWGSVTVVASDPLAADVLATALFVRGPDGALDRARELPDAAVLVVEEGSAGPRVRWSPSVKRLLSGPTRTGRAAVDAGDRG